MAAGQQPAPGAPGAVRTPNIAQLAAARQAANNAIQKGWLLIGLGIAITIGTFVLAPGGFFIISFGPVIAGINNVSRGRKHLQKVHAVERQLFPHGPQRY